MTLPLFLLLTFRPRDFFWNSFLVLWLDPQGFSQWVMTLAFLFLLALGRFARRSGRVV